LRNGRDGVARYGRGGVEGRQDKARGETANSRERSAFDANQSRSQSSKI
jgi:hypothetical protein